MYYKNDCYCKVTIADPSIYNSSDCSDIVFSSGNSNKNDCIKPCSRKNLVLGRESDGNLNNNTCNYSAVLDTDANLDCTQSCKNTWGKSGFISASSNSSSGCSCKYKTICN